MSLAVGSFFFALRSSLAHRIAHQPNKKDITMADFVGFSEVFELNGKQVSVSFGPNMHQWDIKFGADHERRAFDNIATAQQFLSGLGSHKFDLRKAVSAWASAQNGPQPGSDD
jgi:hypothetical protein